jgi:DNA polymerase-3 subunit alpha
MASPGFVHLRVHSAYSLSEGAIKPKDLLKLCKKHAMPAVAVTDTGNLFGALEFSSAAVDDGIQPILGCVLSVGRVESGARTLEPKVAQPDQLVLIAQTAVGWRNLMKLVSKAFMETEPGLPPQVTYPEVEALAEGLIALTGGIGGGVGRLVGACWPAPRRSRQRLLLVRRHVAVGIGHLYAPILAYVAGFWRHRWYGPWPGLYFTSINANQMVSR